MNNALKPGPNVAYVADYRAKIKEYMILEPAFAQAKALRDIGVVIRSSQKDIDKVDQIDDILLALDEADRWPEVIEFDSATQLKD